MKRLLPTLLLLAVFLTACATGRPECPAAQL